MGGLLSFLTGLSGGASESIDQERKQAQLEQENELSYRRTNLEHMVKAAEEGRVNPDMVGRVYEEYMNSMQGLGSKPQSKGRAGFLGKKDLGENSLLRELATGAVGLFGPQPGALNIDWGAAQPSQAPGMVPYKGGPGLPSEVPDMVTTPGRPLEQLINEGYGATRPPAGGNWLMKHPDMLSGEQEQEGLLKTLAGERAKGLINYEQLVREYGSPEALNEARSDQYGNRGLAALTPQGMQGVVYLDPATNKVHHGVLMRSGPMAGLMVSSLDGQPLDRPGFIDVSKQFNTTSAGGDVTHFGTGGVQTGRTPGAGRPYYPPSQASTTKEDPRIVTRRAMLNRQDAQIQARRKSLETDDPYITVNGVRRRGTPDELLERAFTEVTAGQLSAYGINSFKDLKREIVKMSSPLGLGEKDPMASHDITPPAKPDVDLAPAASPVPGEGPATASTMTFTPQEEDSTITTYLAQLVPPVPATPAAIAKVRSSAATMKALRDAMAKARRQ